MKQLLKLTQVNFKNFLREPEILFWALIFPAAIAGVLGFAFNRTELPPVRVAVVADARDPAFLRLQERLAGAAGTADAEIAGRVELLALSRADAVLAVRQAKVALYVTLDAGGRVFAYFDRNNADAKLAWLVLEHRFNGQSEEARVSARLEESAGSRYIDFLIPGLIALGVMNSSMWGVGYGLIDLRVKKLLRRMVASPMHRWAFLTSHFLARLCLSATEGLILFAFAALFFGVRLAGSPLAAALVFLAGVIAWSGIAILGSSRAESMSAANGILNAVTLPMTIVSGIFFSYHNFPQWAQKVIAFLPLTVLADALRAVFVEGAGVAASLLPVAILTGTGLVFFAIGLRVYRWY